MITILLKNEYNTVGFKNGIWGIMLNGINNEDIQSTAERQIGISSVVTNPINNPYKNIDKNFLIDESAISDEALNLYQKEQDVQGFNQLAMSNPEDLSHEDIIAQLFKNGVCDPFSDETLQSLSENENLIADLNLEADV